MRMLPFVAATLFAASSFAIASPGTADVPSADVHMSLADPVAVSLATEGPLLRGVPFTLEATLTARWADLDDATVSIELPAGIAAIGATEASMDLRLDEPARITFRLVDSSEGARELIVRVSGVDANGHALGGQRHGYLVMPMVGPGEFHEDFVPATQPRTMIAPSIAYPPLSDATMPSAPSTTSGRQAGTAVPPRLPAEAPRKAFVEDTDASGAALDSHSTFQVTLCWFYANEASPAVDVAQRGATIQVWDEDDFSDDLLAEGVSGSDGCYNSGNVGREDTDGGAGNQDVFVRIHLCDTWVCAQGADEEFVVYRVDYGTVGDEDVINLGNFKAADGDAMAARAFQYAYNSASFARNHMQVPGFTEGGPRVDIWAPSTDGNCSPGGMFNRLGEDRIHVCTGADRSPEDVGHEYGHFVNDKMYGDSFWPSPNGAHNLCTDSQNRGLSWVEGWGNFYGPRVGLEEVAPSSDNNVNYDRPWDGSSFSINMETATWCGTGVAGDDNEMNVAQTLWDIRDTIDDGVDTGSASNNLLATVLGDCDNNNFREYFDSGCSFVSHSGSACTFMRAAWQNNVDFDDNDPTSTITSQASYAWVHDTITLSANAADSDNGCIPSVTFRISHDSVCDASDTLVDADPGSPYVVNFDTNTFSEDASVWTCARASDGMQFSPWSTSASSIGIDNTPPSVSLSVAGTLGNAGWYTSPVSISLPCTDALSGVDDIWYWLDSDPVAAYTAPFPVSGQGIHTIAYECSDNAGNLDSDLSIVKIDTLDPSTTAGEAGLAGENGWYIGDVTVSMTCSDPVPGSGCFNTQVSHTSADASVDVFDYAGQFVLTGDGVHTVAYHSVDVAGNVETTQSIDIAIDTLPPTGEITTVTDGVFTYTGAYAAGGLFTNAATLTVSYHATDAASGLQLVSTSGDSDAYTGQLDVNGALVISLPLGISTWTLTAEDMAGHTAEIGTFSVARVAPGVTNPQTSGWWKNAVKPFGYTQAQLEAMFPALNLGSHSLGFPDARYDDLSAANYDTYLKNSPSTDDERVRKELTAAWLNLASGREAAGQAVTLAGTSWSSVVTNTGGSSSTTALNVVLQAEQRLREAPDSTLLTNIKSVLASLNTGALND